jgi:hypothetical protein
MGTDLIPRLRYFATGFLALILGMLIAVSTLAWFPSQTPKKIFTRPRLMVPEIVQVFRIENNNRKVKFDAGMDAGDEWLNGTSFSIKNYSGKTIIYIELDLTFPETKSDSRPTKRFPLYLGRMPGVESEAETRRDLIAIPPEGEATLTLDEREYERLKRFIEAAQPISSINKVSVRPYFVIFDDGFAWGQGEYYRRDPDDPKKYKPIGLQLPTK